MNFGVFIATGAASCVLAMSICACAGCAVDSNPETPADPVAQEEYSMDETGSYYLITADQAHGMMVSNGVVILDVRTQEEYDASHIVNAKLMPYDAITEDAISGIAPRKDEPVLVYCRTGRRSAEACASLAALGYTNVYDFGGIVDWPYSTIDAEEPDGSTVKNDQAPVGVKIVCGQPTRSVPETD